MNRADRIPSFDCERCKQCGLCVFICPVDAIAPQDQSAPALARPEACTSCRACELICPDFAIEMVERDPAEIEFVEGAVCVLGPPVEGPPVEGPPVEGGL
jgi:2-oxoglutarate ferredoxin oxidoreductase subunit delta